GGRADRRRAPVALGPVAVGRRMTGRFVEVALKLPVDTTFTYGVPEAFDARPGHRARVPFRGRDMAGVAVALPADCGDVPPDKVRPLSAVLDATTTLPEPLLELGRRMARDYGCTLGEALDAMLPAVTKQHGARRVPHLVLNVSPDIALRAIDELEEKHQQQARVLRAVLEFGAPMPVVQVRRDTGTSDSPWKTLTRHGILRRVLIDEAAEPLEPDVSAATERWALNQDQQRAVDAVTRASDENRSEVFLLHGITGSGKTEV